MTREKAIELVLNGLCKVCGEANRGIYKTTAIAIVNYLNKNGYEIVPIQGVVIDDQMAS